MAPVKKRVGSNSANSKVTSRPAAKPVASVPIGGVKAAAAKQKLPHSIANTPVVSQQQNIAQTTSPVNKKIDYAHAGKNSFFHQLIDSLPAGAYPTSMTPKILGAIFALVVIHGVMQFPFFGVFGEISDISVGIGIPLVFLEFNLGSPEVNPIRIGNLVVDLLIYVFLAYFIDILINMVMHTRLLKAEEEKRGIPKVWKDRGNQGNLAQRATNKMFKG